MEISSLSRGGKYNAVKTPGARTRRRVLYIFCSPEDAKQLQLEREVMAIKEAGLIYSEDDLLLNSDWEALKWKLCQTRYDIVHFGGHARRDGMALKDPQTGKRQVIAPEHMAALLSNFKSIKAVVLNACYTESIAEMCTAAGIPFAMYWKGKVHDDAAPTFSKFFYLAALNNMSYSEAFNIAREQMRAHGFVIANPDDFLLGAVGHGHNCECVYSVTAHGLPGFKIARKTEPLRSDPRMSYSTQRRHTSQSDVWQNQELRVVKTAAWPNQSPLSSLAPTARTPARSSSSQGFAVSLPPTMSRSPSAFGIRY